MRVCNYEKWKVTLLDWKLNQFSMKSFISFYLYDLLLSLSLFERTVNEFNTFEYLLILYFKPWLLNDVSYPLNKRSRQRPKIFEFNVCREFMFTDVVGHPRILRGKERWQWWILKKEDREEKGGEGVDIGNTIPPGLDVPIISTFVYTLFLFLSWK